MPLISGDNITHNRTKQEKTTKNSKIKYSKILKIRYQFNSEKEAKDRKFVTTYVPDINNDCIKKINFKHFLAMAKFQVANQNKISNQIRSQIRRVHGTKHHDKIIENGPNGKNDQKYSKTIYSYI